VLKCNEMRVVLRIAPAALLVLPLALGFATSLRLGGEKPTLGLTMMAGTLVALVLSPAYFLLAIGLGIAGLRLHRGLKTSQGVLVAMIVSSAVVIGVSVWALSGIVSSRSSTSALGFFALPVLTLVPGVLSFGLTWALMLLIGPVSRPRH
jgi:hypothetical protein